MARRFLPFAIAAALSAVAAPAALAGGGAVAAHLPAQSPSEVRGYWTPERMAAAEPLEAPAAAPDDAPAPTASASSIPPDFETDPARDTAYPERIHGRLFLKFGADDASCSATVVTSFTRNLILTAGHCVVTPTVSGPQWASNVLFVPGYRNNVSPFGSYPAIGIQAPLIWAFEGDISLDIGAINLAPGPGGQIQDVLGSRGVSFNRTVASYRNRSFQLFGYPAKPEPAYDGERLIVCNAKFAGFEQFTFAPVAQPCNMQQGSSGGGWVINGGLVNSIVSHAACANPFGCDAIAGTFFGTTAFKLWSAAGGGIPKGRRKQLKACKRKRGKKKSACVMRAQTFAPVLG